MNIRTLVLSTVLVLLVISGMQAQRPEIIARVDLGPSTNYSLENAQTFGISWNFGAGIGFGPLSVLANLGFDQFIANRDEIAEKNPDIWTGSSTEVYSLSNYPMSFLTISGNLLYRFTGSEEGRSFYLLAGAAVFRVAHDDIRVTSERGARVLAGSRRHSFGLTAGLGFEMPIFKDMIWLYGESKFGVGIAGDQREGQRGFEPHYINLRVGGAIKL